jgi:hypothetical protein
VVSRIRSFVAALAVMCSLSVLAAAPSHAAGKTALTGDLSLGKGIISLFPMNKSEDRPTALIAQVRLNLNNVGPFNFHFKFRQPLYDGNYWFNTTTKAEAGFDLNLNHSGTSQFFADYEWNYNTGSDWAWFGYRQKFKLF